MGPNLFLGFWVSCKFWVVLVFRSSRVFWVLFCGLARLFLCILSMYLGAPYAF